MYCKRCGMDSENTEVCDWCKQPMIAGGPQPESDAETEAEVAPQSEVEVTPMAPAEETAGDDAAYVPDEEPLPKVT
ncbi:MAG: hypothetical protein GTN65_16040, partial [Armatimonadetes bacterium]|nr:hypothetical protein [Armatimonadota bacterium]NIO98564.1 hypothetical protein [Armatimonadota bacterium]